MEYHGPLEYSLYHSHFPLSEYGDIQLTTPTTDNRDSEQTRICTKHTFSPRLQVHSLIQVLLHGRVEVNAANLHDLHNVTVVLLRQDGEGRRRAAIPQLLGLDLPGGLLSLSQTVKALLQ